MTSALVFGTTHQTPATNWRDGFRGMWPAGEGHAVPEGARVALCGTEPPFLWPGEFDARSRVLDVCRTCAALAPGTRSR